MKTHQLATLLWLVSSFSGGQTLVDVKTQTKNVDFSGAASTIPARSGSSVPTSCKVGEMFFNTSNAPGQNLYLCAPANTWTVLAGGGSGSTVGTVLSGSNGQFAYYAAGGSTVSGHSLVVSDIPALPYQAPLTFTGNGAKTASSTGTVSTNDCAKWDANGNIVDAGAPCGAGSGSSSFSGLTTGTNTSAALTIGSGASLGATGTGTITATAIAASGVSGLAASATTDATNASNITSGTLAAARLPVTAVTTSNASGTGTKFASVVAAGAANNCTKWDANGNVVDAGAPCSAGAPSFATLTTGTNTSAALTIGSGASLGATGTGTITATAIAASGVSGLAASATTDATNASNITSGTLAAARLPATAVTTSSASGTGGKFVSAAAAGGTNNCAKWDANGNLIDTGAPCSNGNFSSLGGGTNASQNFVVGSGASFTATGTGVISATTVPASGVTGTLAASQVSGIYGGGSITQAKSLIAAGDSITYGYLAGPGSTPVSGNSYAYPAYVNGDAGTVIQNDAISGISACDLTSRETMKLDPFNSSINNQFVYTLMVGTNDANNNAGSSAYGTNIFQPCHQAAIAWNALGNKFLATDTTAAVPGICHNTGTWTFQNTGGWSVASDFSYTNGSTKTCPITTYGGPLYFWYFVQDNHTTATMSYAVDGGAAVNVNGFTAGINSQNGGGGAANYGFMLQRITGLTAGAHTIVFTVTGPTNSTTSPVMVYALGTPPAAPYVSGPKVFVGGVPRQNGDANPAWTALFNSYALADVNTLAGDGLNVYFVDVRSYLCTNPSGGSCYNASGVADMNTVAADPGQLHPNPQGQQELKQAFEAKMQAAIYVKPYLGTGGNTLTGTGVGISGNCAKWDANGNVIDAGAPCGTGSGAVSAGTAGQFAYYSAAGSSVAGRTLVAGDIPALSYQAPLSFSGVGAKTVSASAAGASGNCVKWLASGDLGDAGAACGAGGSGMVYPGAGVPNSTGAAWGTSYTVGTAANNLVQLNAAAQLPALSGANLTGLTATQVAGLGTLATQSSVTAAQLPAPTSSTLGGVQSAAAVSHQWVAAISTAGVPALAQPAFTDVSGAASDAQLPTDQCTLTKYTVLSSSLTSQASATPTVTLATLPSTSTRICLVEISGTTSFAGTGITAATVRLQSGATTPVLYSPNQDVFNAVGPTTNNYWTDSGNMADRTNQSVVAAFTLTGATSSSLTAGSVFITIGTRTMP